MTMVGADADALDAAAAELDAAAAELNANTGALGGILNAVAWIGQVASAFVGLWNSEYKPRLGSTAQFIEQAADSLRRQAQQQRETSTSAGVPSVPHSFAGSDGGTVGSDDSSATAEIEEWLTALGITGEVAELILLTMRKFETQQMMDVLGKLRAGPIEDLLRVADDVLGAGTFLLDVVQDYGDHPDLEGDDRLIHALVDAGAQLARDKGVEFGAMALVGALGSFVPGAGTVAGAAIGRLVGQVLGAALEPVVEAVDDHFDLSEKAADTVVEVWQELEDLDAARLVADAASWTIDQAGRIIDGAGEAIGDAVESGANAVGDAAEALGRGATSLFKAVTPW